MSQTSTTNGQHAMQNGHATSPWTDWSSSFARGSANGRRGTDGHTGTSARSGQPTAAYRGTTRDAAAALMDCYNG